ncbi:MAG: hypothetical protein IMX05_02495 [Hydrogenibacillus schlegelii]|nr:hypothetical protein [Hydrogenibacillus schlegelii]
MFERLGGVRPLLIGLVGAMAVALFVMLIRWGPFFKEPSSPSAEPEPLFAFSSEEKPPLLDDPAADFSTYPGRPNAHILTVKIDLDPTMSRWSHPLERPTLDELNRKLDRPASSLDVSAACGIKGEPPIAKASATAVTGGSDAKGEKSAQTHALGTTFREAVPYRFGSAEGISISKVLRAFSVPNPPEIRLDGTQTLSFAAEPGKVQVMEVLPYYIIYHISFQNPAGRAWLWVPAGVCAIGYVM